MNPNLLGFGDYLEQAKEMEKQQIIDAHIEGNKTYTVGGVYETVAEQYYNDLYGSKGSDEVEKSKKPINLTSSQTEISDEEIEIAATKYATNHGMMAYVFPEKKQAFIDAIKWYREQLKKKQ